MPWSGGTFLGDAVDDLLAVDLGSENGHACVTGNATRALLVEPGSFHGGEDLERAIRTDVADCYNRNQGVRRLGLRCVDVAGSIDDNLGQLAKVSGRGYEAAFLRNFEE
jgi:hypothetical protein